MSAGISVDIDEILDIALRGVRRASMFMGLGVNAAQNEDLKKYQLTGIAQIQLLPQEIPEDQLAAAKDEFRLWVEANGFRELIETFHAFLDAIHLACLKFQLGKGGLSIQEFKAQQGAFAKQGFPNKLNILRQNFVIESKHSDHLVSLNGARNVLTHRLSVVRQRDVNADGVMLVSWLGADILIEESSGAQHYIEEVIEQARSFPEETKVVMRFAPRNREFKVGDRLALSSKDIAEICWFMSL